MPLVNKVDAELIDHGRFADTGNACDPEAHSLSRFRQNILKQRLGRFLMLALARFDERDGAGEGGPVSGFESVGECVGIV